MFNLEAIKPAITRSFGRATLQAQKYSPEILTGVGVVGVVTAGVLASRATLKLSPIIDEKNSLLQTILDTRNDEATKDEYTEEMANKDTAKVYIRTGLDIAKLYAPAVTLGVASLVCIVSAQGIMRKRNAAIMAAYKTVEKAFSEYRERVIEEIGEEQELDIYRDRVEEVVEDEETGKEKTIVSEYPGYSPYAKLFDEMSGCWQKNADYNLMFLRTQEQIFNEKLQARGHVFLNEIYDALDIPHTGVGAIVGWVLGNGDNYIDFGIYDINDKSKAAFVNGYERSILLDFNVDGPIHELI